MREWPFDDKRVRYAFSYLYDRKKINRELMYNEMVPIHSQYSNSPYENPNNEKFNYNPQKAVELLRDAGYTKRNSDGWLVQEGTGRELRFEINIYKSLEDRVTTLQQMLKEYGIDMQIKFMDFNSIIKNVNERNFKITSFGYSGLVFPNPETAMQSSLADKNNNNNIWGFKSERVDELLKEYDVAFDLSRRIEIIQEIDGIWAEVHPTAYGLGENNRKTMWWNKFGYPDWVHSRYGGEFWDAFTYWWYDEEAATKLKSAMSNDQGLPIDPIEIKFWPAYQVNNLKKPFSP
jgi:ABC-type dipeptide transport system, periplasmic component